MSAVNNITRLLDSKKIPYRTFDLPAEKLSADETAHLLGVDPMLVYKTIVVTRERGKPILAIIPGPHRVDLKLLAAALGEKKVNLPTEREAEQLTGLQAGGISPLALLNKGFQVVIASEAENRIEASHRGEDREIHVSGGQRGLNIRLPVRALAELTRARFAVISIRDVENP
jgi:Cys-tRNA(Pro)/Cys-tRNA(Cys) deacylase